MIHDNDNNNTNINDNDNNLDGNLGLECQGLVGEHGVGTVGPARMGSERKRWKDCLKSALMEAWFCNFPLLK